MFTNVKINNSIFKTCRIRNIDNRSVNSKHKKQNTLFTQKCFVSMYNRYKLRHSFNEDFLLALSKEAIRRTLRKKRYAFRGRLMSLLAPTRGMPTLPAKGGFSRPSPLRSAGSHLGLWGCA